MRLWSSLSRSRRELLLQGHQQKKHPQGVQLSMALQSRLGEDLDVQPEANSYSGPALAMYDETLECLHTEQWVGVQSVTTTTIISCRETKVGDLCKIQSRHITEQTCLFHEQSRQSSLRELPSFAPVTIFSQGWWWQGSCQAVVIKGSRLPG